MTDTRHQLVVLPEMVASFEKTGESSNELEHQSEKQSNRSVVKSEQIAEVKKDSIGKSSRCENDAYHQDYDDRITSGTATKSVESSEEGRNFKKVARMIIILPLVVAGLFMLAREVTMMMERSPLVIETIKTSLAAVMSSVHAMIVTSGQGMKVWQETMTVSEAERVVTQQSGSAQDVLWWLLSFAVLIPVVVPVLVGKIIGKSYGAVADGSYGGRESHKRWRRARNGRLFSDEYFD